jgi:Ca2+-binding EF-hand superfamily protein
VIFIRALQRRADGTQSEAVKNGEMMPQDVVEAVNGVEVGTDLSVLTKEIDKVEIDGDITFRLSRRAKDEERRLKSLQEKKIAKALDETLHQIFILIDTDKSGKLSLAEIDKAGKQVFLDKLGIHFPSSVHKEGFASLQKFAHIGDGQIDFDEFKGIMYSKEIALCSRNTRYAKYATLFKKLDKDSSGSIDKAEFVAANEMLDKLFGENGTAIAEEFSAADLNDDGIIQFTEFCDICEDFYERHLHPDGYHAEESVTISQEDANNLIEEHFDENHESETGVPENLAEINTLVQSSVSSAAENTPAEDGENTEEPVVSEALAEARAQAAAAAQAAAEKKEAEDQQKHREEIAAAKKKKEEEKKLKEQQLKEEQKQVAKSNKEESEVAAPASSGCCVIA